MFGSNKITSGEGGKDRAAELVLDWDAETPSEFFDFDVEMSPEPIARSMAAEPWSIAYFRELKKTQQSHYEQWGTMKGYLAIDGVRNKSITKWRRGCCKGRRERVREGCCLSG